jgi:GH25 family lysozyme M1 (1,4-beta-N-acetylmuramidase)
MPLIAGAHQPQPLFGVDVASYQGSPDWKKVYGAGIRFAFSKVTEGTGYTNPTWTHNRAGMLALGDGFLPGAYHFLRSDADPAAQARHFHRQAGDLAGFAVALDVEPSGSSRPTAAQARAWVAEYKRLSGGHPVIGYYPRWYWEQTGRPDLSFFDTIWQSRYVNGTGSPQALYAKVPQSWWEPHGGEPISILQFTSSATVPGIAGRCDANAYRGTLDQLRQIALGDDMPLTDADVKRIADAVFNAVWRRDAIKAPTSATTYERNPTWKAESFLTDTGEMTRKILTQVAALAQRQGAPVDTEAIVQGVLAGLSPAQVASHLASALGPSVAKAVANELHKRLES